MRHFSKPLAWQFLLFILYSFIVFPEQKSLNAQPVLDRISASDRADGLGFVIRFHLTETGLQYKFAQTSSDTLQLTINHPNFHISEPLMLPDHPDVSEINYLKGNDEWHFEIALSGLQSYTSTSYFDQNERDILIAFQYEENLDVHQIYDSPIFPSLQKPETEVKDATEITLQPLESLPQISEEHEQISLRAQRFPLLPNDPLKFYLRWIAPDLKTSTDAVFRYSGGSFSIPNNFISDHPWNDHHFFQNSIKEPKNYTFFDPVLFFSSNSDYPMGNGADGALWQGKGLNTSLSIGGAFVSNYFEVVVRPIFVHSDNRDFTLSPHPPFEGLSEFAMSRSYSDIPQRFGAASYSRLDPGESYIRAKYQGWTAGLSTQRIATGPAMFNPLLFGPNAPGFLHTFVGTDEPFHFLKGKFESRIFWGSLQDSGFFYGDRPEELQRDSRFITGFTFHYSPNFLQGLQIGFTRTGVRYFPEDGLTFKDLFLAGAPRLEKDPNMNPDHARFIKSSLFLRWHFPDSGFEVYTEWGRNDNKRSFRDFISEPEFNRGYVLGFLKQFEPSRKHRVLLFGEITNIENSTLAAQNRDFNIWYTHPVIQQGFTNRGKVMGASIGPGSNTQQLGASYYNRFGMAGFRLGRISYNTDRLMQNLEYYRSTLQRPWIPTRRMLEVEMFGTLNLLVFLPRGFELQADLRYGIIESRNNRYEVITGRVTENVFIDESNLNLAFTLRYGLNFNSR